MSKAASQNASINSVGVIFLVNISVVGRIEVKRACSSVWAQNTVGLQSSRGVQEPHVTMPTLRTTQLFSSSAWEEIILN